MNIWIPDHLFINEENKDNVYVILAGIPETCIHTKGIKTLSDAVIEIEQIGEKYVAKYLRNR